MHATRQPSSGRAAHTRAARLCSAALLCALGLVAPRMQAQPADAPREASRDDAAGWLNEAWRLRAGNDLAGAVEAFGRARAAGADRQLVELELGYVALRRTRRAEARAHFEAAATGPSATRAASARAELRNLPRHLWADFYGEAWAWTRVAGPPSADLVPTLRLRAFWRPWLDEDLNLYAYAQATRDVASEGNGTIALSRIYADNHALLGAGLLLRLWDGRLSFFAQGGPAINLLDDGRARAQLDVRVGMMLVLQTPGCRPPVAAGVRALAGACAEGYGEAVYVSRFNDDVVALVRARAAYSLLVTGPVAWQPLLEARALLGRNRDYWNNLAEAGVALRARLLRPFALDLLVGVHAGTYLGIEGADPLPDPQQYVEGRVLLTTYLEL